MSATARAAGDPAGGRPARRTPPPPEGTAVPRRGVRPASAPPLRSAARTRPAESGPVPAPDRGVRTAPAPPVRRASTAPVRTGSLRGRPGPTPAAGSPAFRLRRAVGAHRAPFVLLVVTLLVATTLALLFLNTAIAVNSLEAAQRAAANDDRAQEVQRLERQVIAGGTPVELARRAREAGLVPAGPAAYLVLGEDGSVTLRGRAVPAEEPQPGEVPALPPPPVAGGGN